MAWKSRQRTAWLTITIVLSLGLMGTASSGTARESTIHPPSTSTDWRDDQGQQNAGAIPLKGSPELWKFRFIIER